MSRKLNFHPRMTILDFKKLAIAVNGVKIHLSPSRGSQGYSQIRDCGMSVTRARDKLGCLRDERTFIYLFIYVLFAAVWLYHYFIHCISWNEFHSTDKGNQNAWFFKINYSSRVQTVSKCRTRSNVPARLFFKSIQIE